MLGFDLNEFEVYVFDVAPGTRLPVTFALVGEALLVNYQLNRSRRIPFAKIAETGGADKREEQARGPQTAESAGDAT